MRRHCSFIVRFFLILRIYNLQFITVFNLLFPQTRKLISATNVIMSPMCRDIYFPLTKNNSRLFSPFQSLLLRIPIFFQEIVVNFFIKLPSLKKTKYFYKLKIFIPFFHLPILLYPPSYPVFPSILFFTRSILSSSGRGQGSKIKKIYTPVCS